MSSTVRWFYDDANGFQRVTYSAPSVYGQHCYLQGTRVGEASHPGPSAAERMEALRLRVCTRTAQAASVLGGQEGAQTSVCAARSASGDLLPDNSGLLRRAAAAAAAPAAVVDPPSDAIISAVVRDDAGDRNYAGQPQQQIARDLALKIAEMPAVRPSSSAAGSAEIARDGDGAASCEGPGIQESADEEWDFGQAIDQQIEGQCAESILFAGDAERLNPGLGP